MGKAKRRERGGMKGLELMMLKSAARADDPAWLLRIVEANGPGGVAPSWALIAAAEEGSVACVRAALPGALAMGVGASGEALLGAARAGREATVRELLSLLDLKAECPHLARSSALGAARLKNPACAVMILDAFGARAEKWEREALSEAVEWGSVETARALRARVGEINESQGVALAQKAAAREGALMVKEALGWLEGAGRERAAALALGSAALRGERESARWLMIEGWPSSKAEAARAAEEAREWGLPREAEFVEALARALEESEALSGCSGEGAANAGRSEAKRRL